MKPKLPFPVIGSLNGVHMFANSHDVQLLSTTTDDAKIVWKVFQDSITLIIVSKDDRANDCHFNKLLDNVYQCIVLLCGKDDVSSIKNVERFKREIRVCNSLLDTLLEQADLPLFSDLTNAVDVIAAPETTILQNILEAFCEAADSPYGCLYVHGKVAVASRKWWSFSSTELVILQLLIRASSNCTSRDFPVFLPQLSPSVPHRLMTFLLIKNVEVCVICGPTPSLTELHGEVNRFWKTGLESLKSIVKVPPRNIPNNILLDTSLLGFLLVNTETHKCLSTVNPHGLEDHLSEIFSPDKRRKALRTFYKHVVGTYFATTIEGSEKGCDPSVERAQCESHLKATIRALVDSVESHYSGSRLNIYPAIHHAYNLLLVGPSDFSHKPMETYTTGESYKCYAIQNGPHQLYILYSKQIPTFAMRSISQKTLQLLTKDKHIHV